jgi:hypothetical protein
MRKTSILALVLALALWHGPAAAESTTPLVPHDIGHWINLEHRTGNLAPEIAGNRILVRTILVVERSLAKIDAYLSKSRRTSGCHQLLLPYTRFVVEQHSETNERGDIVLTNRRARRDEKLGAMVCSTIDHRAVFWEVDGSMMILSRPRDDYGGFPRTYYALFQISADERSRWQQRRERMAARGKLPKPPKVSTLYEPLGEEPILRPDDSMTSFFGAEFGLPEITAGKLASEQPTSGRPPPEPGRPDR